MADEDEWLRALGDARRARREEAEAAAEEGDGDEAPGGISDDALYAYARGELDDAAAEEVEAAAGDDPAVGHRLALLLRSVTPLDPAVEEALVDGAARALRRPPSLGERIRAWLAAPWLLPAGGLALAAALLTVFGPRLWGPAVDLPRYEAEISGQQKAWQGSGEQPEGDLPTFGPHSEVRVVLAADAEGVVVDVAAYAQLGEGAPWAPLAPEGPATVLIGPGGILLRGEASRLFGAFDGEVRLLFVVTPQGAGAPSPGEGPGALDALQAAEEEGRVRLVQTRLRYAGGEGR